MLWSYRSENSNRIALATFRAVSAIYMSLSVHLSAHYLTFLNRALQYRQGERMTATVFIHISQFRSK